MDYRQIISNEKVYGLESSIKRAKYPMSTDIDKLNTDLTDGIKKLAQSGRGEGHDQWLTGVVVQFDLTFTVKCWTEAERYHFLDFISSQSTMHRITKFDLDKAYIEYVDPRIVEIMKEKVALYNEMCAAEVRNKMAVINELILIELLTSDDAKIGKYLVGDVKRKMAREKSDLSSLVAQYGIELLVNKDERQAMIVLKYIEDVFKTYPYNVELTKETIQLLKERVK